MKIRIKTLSELKKIYTSKHCKMIIYYDVELCNHKFKHCETSNIEKVEKFFGNSETLTKREKDRYYYVYIELK